MPSHSSRSRSYQSRVDLELSNRTTRALYLLELATASTIDEPIVIDFARMLRIIGYWFPRTRLNLPFRICGKHRRAKTDICLVDYDQNHRILLVVREDKRVEGGDPASAQVRIVAAAVGAFTENNRTEDGSWTRTVVGHG